MAFRKRPLSREEKIVLKREKDHQHHQFWNDQQKYYDRWDKTNTKYEEWTSPRYYDTNTQLVRKMQMEKTFKERLELRREKLQKLFRTERMQWEEELRKLKEEQITTPRSARTKFDDIPTEILKQVHEGIKDKMEEKRKKEAELKLYHQWRNDNSFIQEYERAQRSKDLKMSWLHQQMEKRKRKEQEKAEEERLLREREERLKLEAEEEEQRKKETERRNKELKEVIEKQVQEIKTRQTVAEKLRLREEEITKKKVELEKLKEKQKLHEQLTANKELALFNIKQYKIKLKEKLKIIRDNIKEQEELVKRLKDLDLAEKIEDERVKADIKQSIEEFLRITKEQKQLEELREKNLQFVFDSEARKVFERQSDVWDREDLSRKTLIRDVLSTIAEQIESNAQKSRQEREALIKERETLVTITEKYNEELKQLQEEEKQRQQQRKAELDREVKEKQEREKATAETNKIKIITEELEKAKIEEERLKREILNLHKGQGLCRPSTRSNIKF